MTGDPAKIPGAMAHPPKKVVQDEKSPAKHTRWWRLHCFHGIAEYWSNFLCRQGAPLVTHSFAVNHGIQNHTSN